MPNLPPRRRSGRPSWTEPIINRLTPTTKAFVVASGILYLFYVVVRPARELMIMHLAVGPRLLAGEVWQPFTALFFTPEFVGFILNTIGIWFMGPLLEKIQGTKQAVALFLVAGVGSNLVQVAIAPGVLTWGSSDALLALFVAYGRIFGRTETPVWGALYMQARTLAIVFVGLAILGCIFQRSVPALAGVLTATLVGYVGGKPGGFAEAWASLRARRARRRYQVLEGGGGRAKKKYVN